MSQKKSGKDLKTHTAHTQTVSKGSLIKFLIGAAIVCAIVWGLIVASTPPSNLEPYDKFKKDKTAEKEIAKAPDSQTSGVEDAPAVEDEDSPSEVSPLTPEEEAIRDKIQQISDQTSPITPSPDSPLTHEALEHLSKGMELVEKGKFEFAELEFEKAAEISPESPEVYAIWATALRMQEKFKGANKRFARALELSPNDEEIVFNWGLSLLMERQPDEAIKLFKQTIELSPNHFFAYNSLGKAYGQKKMYPEEEASYRKAVEIKPDFGLGYFNLGIVLSLQKKFPEAADNFEKAIALDQEYAKPFVVQLLTAMGRENPLQKAELKKSGEPDKVAKLDEKAPPPDEHKDEEKFEHEEVQKPEGSDSNHEMEGSGSKITKETTNIQGKVTVNGEKTDSNGLVILETKTKLKVPGQKILKVTIFQRNLQFEPMHSVIPVGSTVTFMNDDREVHNIYSKSLNNQFNLGAMAAGTGREMQMSSPGPVILRCNLHKDMIGTLFVVPNGYFTETNESGEYSFDEVESNEYIMQFWHPRLYPEEIEQQAKNLNLTGADLVEDLKISSQSQPGEIHDLVDDTDYNLVVDSIEKEMKQAIIDWKSGKKFISRKRMLIAITKHYDGEGLKGALAKSFSEKRSENLEERMDSIRKKISGLDKSEEFTEESLNFQAERIVAQLRNNVKELETRLNPGKTQATQ